MFASMRDWCQTAEKHYMCVDSKPLIHDAHPDNLNQTHTAKEILHTRWLDHSTTNGLWNCDSNMETSMLQLPQHGARSLQPRESHIWWVLMNDQAIFSMKALMSFVVPGMGIVDYRDVRHVKTYAYDRTWRPHHPTPLHGNFDTVHSSQCKPNCYANIKWCIKLSGRWLRQHRRCPRYHRWRYVLSDLSTPASFIPTDGQWCSLDLWIHIVHSTFAL